MIIKHAGHILRGNGRRFGTSIGHYLSFAAGRRENGLLDLGDVTPGLKAKTRCSLYVCPGSSCHTYSQNVNTENQCLYYINIITWDIVFTQKTISTLSSNSSGTHPFHGQSTGATQASRRNLHHRRSSHLQLMSSVTTRVSRLMVATQQV
jgi:hypothetical protein